MLRLGTPAWPLRKTAASSALEMAETAVGMIGLMTSMARGVGGNDVGKVADTGRSGATVSLRQVKCI